SGGVKSIEDIMACKEIGLYGCVCGKALYSGALDLREAIEKAGE
ncbi:HisA/HisF-related TIM barrel protein, partial [Acinetobacter pittii]